MGVAPSYARHVLRLGHRAHKLHCLMLINIRHASWVSPRHTLGTYFGWAIELTNCTARRPVVRKRSGSWTRGGSRRRLSIRVRTLDTKRVKRCWGEQPFWMSAHSFVASELTHVVACFSACLVSTLYTGPGTQPRSLTSHE